MPTTTSIPLTLLLCLLSTVAAATHHRHLLHQPFFPVITTAAPPAIPPAVSPQPQPQTHQPKYPFTSTTPATPQKPFFPNFPSPPPPPPPPHTLATFPANISSVLFPHPPSSSSPFTGRHLIISLAISLPLLLAAALFAFLIYSRRRRKDTSSTKTENSRLFPPNTVSSESPPPPPKIPPRSGVPSTSSSEFLYLGTLANPHTPDYQQKLSALAHNVSVKASVSPFAATAATTTTSPYQKLDSPELRPLPPLPKLNYTPTYRSGEVLLGPNSKRHDTEEDDVEEDGDEEFYSPIGSSGRKDPLGSPAPVQVVVVGSSSRSDIRVQGNNFYGSDGSFNSRTASYPLSNAGFPPTNNNSVVTTPSHASKSSHKGVIFEDNSPETIISFAAPAKRSSPPSVSYSSSSLSSPASSLSSPRERGTGTSWNLMNSPSPDRVLGFQKRDRAFLVNQTVPPPPPPPPTRFWEVPIGPTDLASSERPPVVVTPSNPVTFQSEVCFPDRDHVQGNLGLDGNEETSKPKLKPLHWDKVRASSGRAMVWDQIKSSSFQLNEEMIETLFTVNNPNLAPKDCNGRRQSLPLANENRVLEPRKSQNIAILLRALNVTIEEVCEALVEGNSDTLGTELLESLMKMAPSKEEERKLKEFKDESPVKLGPAEKFLKAVIEIPFAFKRIDAMIYIANFDSEVEYLRRSFDTLEAACGELKNSRLFFKLLEAVLKTGNRMNVGTNRGDARAFKLDTLLKLVDVKGSDGKTTLLHFVVQEIIRSEGSRLCDGTETMTPEPFQQSDLQDDVRYRNLGLQVVSGLSGEFSNVKKAAAMDSDVLSGEVLKLSGGVTKVRGVLKLNEEIALKETSRKFSDSMMGFLNKAAEDIMKIQAQEEVALILVKEITEYFHGNSAKEEAHPFRIFMVVRDFLSVLDRVCKEVGKINERTICSTVRPLLVTVEPSPVFPQFHVQQHCSSEDESP